MEMRKGDGAWCFRMRKGEVGCERVDFRVICVGKC